MKIAILGGTGEQGPGLALRWARAGEEVIIGSRQREKGERVATEHTALVRMLDKAAAHGALHKNTAARRKAQAAKLVAGSRV